MQKRIGGGMAAAAALMTSMTKVGSKRRGLDSHQSFEWLLSMYVERPQRPFLDLIEHPEAPAPSGLLLRVAEHMSPEPALIRKVFHTILDMHPSPSKANPVEEDELAEIGYLVESPAFADDVAVQILFLRVLLRRRAYNLALPKLVAAPTSWFIPELWHETLLAVTHGRLHHNDLLHRLLDETTFPPGCSAAATVPLEVLYPLDKHEASLSLGSGSTALEYLPPGSSPVAYGFDESLASRVLLATPTNPAVAVRIIKRYIATVSTVKGATLHPAPFLAFFKCIQEVRDPDTKLPMVHWRMALRYFQMLNRSCPDWAERYPHEAADLVRYLILVLSAGANPFMTLSLARVAASRRILDGVELSIWLLHRMVLQHHVEEGRHVASKLVHWLFHVVGIHLLPAYQSHLPGIVRALISMDAMSEVTSLHNIVVEHAPLYSEEFRASWMIVMKDLVCGSCGAVLTEHNIHHERCCRVCMHVTAAAPLNETPSYALSREHVELTKKRKKAAHQEGWKRVQKFALQSTASSKHTLGVTVTPSLAPQVDAAETFRNSVLRSDADATLGTALEIGGDIPEGASSLAVNHESATDLRSAVEEAHRRHQLMETARRAKFPDLPTPVLVPGSIANMPDTVRERLRAARERAVLNQTVRLDAVWNCVWCQEENAAYSGASVTCGACGAETGPEAPWRTFLNESTGDVMTELRLRICSGELSDALIASFNLMVYRKMFLFTATPSDHALIHQLIHLLVAGQERVLAGYLLMRLVPPMLRSSTTETFRIVAAHYGNSERLDAKIRQKSFKWMDDTQVFDAVFNSEKTCRVCFGLHAWQQCPIITRDFSKTRVPINLTPEEKTAMEFGPLKEKIQAAAALTINVKSGMLIDDNVSTAAGSALHLTTAAYQMFLNCKREKFASDFPVHTNQLARALAHIGMQARGAFVLLHLPLPLRFNATYSDLAAYFGISNDDCSAMLSKRSAVGVVDHTHPNFVQVFRTCCVCLSEQHASFSCPFFSKWMDEVVVRFGNAPSTKVLNASEEQRALANLRARVDGWTSSGPERLQALARFLTDNVEELIQTKHETRNPVAHAFNRVVRGLVNSGNTALALKLYVRLPMPFVASETTEALLVARGYSKTHVNNLMATSPLHGRDATFTHFERCLCCFEKGHGFTGCPEVLGKAVIAKKIQHILRTVGNIRTSPIGVMAASDYVYYSYNFAHLTSELLRNNPELVQDLIKLMHRCFACRLVLRGVRILRRIPIEMLEVEHYEAMWVAAGMPSDLARDRADELRELFEAHQFSPCSKVIQIRRTLESEFIATVAHKIHHGHCRHCYQYGHEIATCEVFKAEASLARDFIAVFRMATILACLRDHERVCLYAHLLRFLIEHQLHLPFYVLGISAGVNSLSASLSMDGEPGLGLKALLLLPPAYRKAHAMQYALLALGCPKLQGIVLVRNTLITGDSPPPLAMHRGDAHSTGTAPRSLNVMEAQHLLAIRPPIPDVHFEQVFGNIDGAELQLKNAEARIEALMTAGSVPPVTSSAAVDDDTLFALAHDFTETHKKMLGSLVRTDSIAREVISSGLPQKTIAGPKTSAESCASSEAHRPIRQVADIHEVRETFEPIISFMETLLDTKLGSRQEILAEDIEMADSLIAEVVGTSQADSAASTPLDSSPSKPTSSPPNPPPHELSVPASSANTNPVRKVSDAPLPHRHPHSSQAQGGRNSRNSDHSNSWKHHKSDRQNQHHYRGRSQDQPSGNQNHGHSHPYRSDRQRPSSQHRQHHRQHQQQHVSSQTDRNVQFPRNFSQKK